MNSGFLKKTALAIGLLSAGLPGLTHAAAAAPAVPVLGQVLETAAARVPDHARGGSVVAGLFNAEALGAGRIAIPLAADRTVVAKRLQEYRGPRGDVTWSGELDKATGSMVVITAHRGAVTGFMHVGEEIWEIAPGAGGRSLIYQVDESKLPPDSEPLLPDYDGADYDTSGTGTVTTQSDATSDAPVTQDVLVIYTAKALATAGSQATMESRIINAVAAANAAYVNSKIGIKLNLVGMARTDYVETGSFDTSLSRLSGTSDGYMDDVHALRDQLRADFVALISEDSTYCGVAYVMGKPSTGFAASAFSVTKQSCFSNQTFAHELGHNQGNTHDRANGWGGSFPYSYGYRTCDNVAPTNGQSFRTVMAYSCSGPRVNYFSNPNVYWNGAPMGVAYEADAANSADNARSMNGTAPYAAQFRSATSALPPAGPNALAAQASAWDRVTLTWNDNAADETGYVIQRSVSGGSWTDRASLPMNATEYTDTGLSGSTGYSYRVRAYNSAGVSTYSNIASVTTPAAPPPPAAPTPAAVTPMTSQATMQWADVTNESGYEVVRETFNSRKGTWSATTLQTPANSTSLTESLAAGTYRYRVRAYNASGSSQAVVGQCSACGSDGSFTITGSTSTTGTKTTGQGRKR
jgi:peptidyl-Asp metalloendopeptidase